MKKKEILLEYLKKQPGNSYIASKKLAEILNVTDRSIRYYVKQINAENEETAKLIETDRSGYRYNHQLREKTEIPDESSVRGRRFRILRHLFQKADEGIDCFDLADELYVSEATVRSDMTVLQKRVKEYGLKITQKNFRYFLLGNEEDKRFLITDLIQKTNNPLLSLEKEMQNFLGDISLADLTSFCHDVFFRHHFSTNSYFEQNFVLHLIVSLNQRNTQAKKDFSSPSMPMVEEISRWLETYDQSIAAGSKAELALLCDGELGHSTKVLESYISPKIAEVLKKGLQELNDTFLIDFTDERFLTRFLVHTQNLYDRIKDNKIKRNLNIADIKVQYPILFDIAVYLSSIISKDLEIEISEDEISFLALHIGSFLDEQKNGASRIRTYLEASSYLNNTTKIQDLLFKKFSNCLNFVQLDGNEDEVELELSVSPQKNKKAEYVRIHDIVGLSDLSRIQKAIERVKRQRYSDFLHEILSKLIHLDAETTFDDSVTKEAVFEKIGQYFFDHDFAGKNFADKLWAREKISPTTFISGISVPHTLKYEANKTALLVLQAENEFNWEDQRIKLVIALAISPRDAHDFNRIFPRMIECLSDEYHVRVLRDSRTRDVFISQLIQFMMKDDYYNE